MSEQHRPHTPLPLAHRMGRRELLQRAAQFGIALPALGAFASACGGSSSSGSGSAASSSGPPTGTAVLLNYDGWMGKNTVADFKAKYPGADLKQASLSSISSGSIVPAIKANMSTYDAALGDQAAVGQGIAADVVQQLDWSQIPNIKNVDAKFREAYTHGIPTDYGKTGIGYRSDLVDEDITSWADVWNLAEKYSNKIVFIDLDRDCIGSALKYKGYSSNSTDDAELNDALNALLDIKPHLQALKSYNIGAGPGEGHLGDRDGLGLRRRPRPGRERRHQVGAALRGRAPPTWRASSPSRTRPTWTCCRRSSTSSWSPASTPTSSTPPAPPSSAPPPRRSSSSLRSRTTRR